MKVQRVENRLVLDTEYDELMKQKLVSELIKQLFEHGLIQVRKEQENGITKYVAESIPENKVMPYPLNNELNHVVYENILNHEDIENYINALPNINDVLLGTRPYIHTVADFKNIPTEDFLQTEYRIPTPVIDWPKMYVYTGVYTPEDSECSNVNMEKLLTEEEGEPANENDN